MFGLFQINSIWIRACNFQPEILRPFVGGRTQFCHNSFNEHNTICICRLFGHQFRCLRITGSKCFPTVSSVLSNLHTQHAHVHHLSVGDISYICSYGNCWCANDNISPGESAHAWDVKKSAHFRFACSSVSRKKIHLRRLLRRRSYHSYSCGRRVHIASHLVSASVPSFSTNHDIFQPLLQKYASLSSVCLASTNFVSTPIRSPVFYLPSVYISCDARDWWKMCCELKSFEAFFRSRHMLAWARGCQ